MNLKANDYKLAAIAGFLTGVCLIPTLVNIQFAYSSLVYGLPVILAVVWVIGLWIGKLLSRALPIMLQLAKFAEIGVLNTVINFGLLNLASLATGVTAGVLAGWYNVPATIVAAGNSYFWNKYWVFHKVDRKGIFHDLPKFVIVTIVGIVVNSLIIIAFTSYRPGHNLTSGQWLNVGKFLATVIGILVDFLGYKFLVFVTKRK